MPRPTSKDELLQLGNEHYNKLMVFIDHMSKEEQEKEFPEGTLNRNIRDVLAHLHHWHLLMLDWYKVGMSGEKPPMPAKGFTWKTTSALNLEIQQKYQSTDLEAIKKILQQSFTNLRKIISKHSNDELFEKKRYKWTGSTSLGAYLVSSTSSHYDWAFKLIRKQKKYKPDQ